MLTVEIVYLVALPLVGAPSVLAVLLVKYWLPRDLLGVWSSWGCLHERIVERG